MPAACQKTRVDSYPTNIHLDLLAHKKIPDPFIGLNSTQVQWIGEQTWLYRASFKTPEIKNNSSEEKLVLQFDGLDTFATVTLNGTKILECENMHRTFRVDVTEVATPGENELQITFESALLKGREVVEGLKFDPVAFSPDADKSRLVVRKAQFHYGWNWGEF